MSTQTNSKPRYYAFDRGATQAREFHNFSAINPRYWIMDRATGAVEDEASTMREARAIAAQMNREARA